MRCHAAPRSSGIAAIAATIAAGTLLLPQPGAAAELRELPDAFDVHCVSDDGTFAFGSVAFDPVRWVRQADGAFAVQRLAPAGEFVLTGTAVDCSPDGSIALIDSALQLATGTAGVWKWRAASGWQLVQAAAGDPIEGSAMSGDAATVAWTREIASPPSWTYLLESNAGLIDFFAGEFVFSRRFVRELSSDGGVAVGAMPYGDVSHPAVWTLADGTWTRVLANLPPGAARAETIDVSDDGVYALVVESDSPVSRCWLWSEHLGYQDLGLAGAEPCACGAVNGDGSVVAGVCRPFDPVLMRWRAGIGWESVLPGAESVTDLSADARYAVGEAQTTGLYWADLGPLPLACADGEDDDGDGSIDLDDAGCASASDTSERDPGVDCDDGWDDDGDGVRDYPMDVGCAGSRDPTETEPLFACDDGIDNDDDGYRDYPSDPGCPIPEARPENPPCDDRSDNDDDGRVDMADPDCSPSWPYWESPPDFASCGLGAEIALAFSFLVAIHRRALRTWRSTPDE